MNSGPRHARVEALAKINLALKVLHKRSDGYHELRTVLQTISLGDTLEIEYTPSRRTKIELVSRVDIPDNLVARAARAVMDATRATGTVRLRLVKRIPMGAGLGGGSSDAAAVLLTLPVLAGGRIPEDQLIGLAAGLGSDVPFFLVGGTAAGIGRGTEVYPLPDYPALPGMLIAPPIHVSTAEAYRGLGRKLTSVVPPNIMNNFQSFAWSGGLGEPGKGTPASPGNDFEDSVFRLYPRLKSLKARLSRIGAAPVMMTGSGSALFGLFRGRNDLEKALPLFQEDTVFRFSLVTRARYRRAWMHRLAAHIEGEIWPPQSRYLKTKTTG
jgi:4-diphosphocytidyl-2-C-methyl-D-erythritol kinase